MLQIFQYFTTPIFQTIQVERFIPEMDINFASPQILWVDKEKDFFLQVEHSYSPTPPTGGQV